MGNAERLMQLFERLPEDDQGEIIHLAEHLARTADPVAWSMDNAPEDDEPLTAEEITEIEAAKAESGSIPWAQVKAELGL